MSCNKPYSHNHISARPSTRIHHPPGGGSSAGSLIFGGDEPTVSNKSDKENANTANNEIEFKDKLSDNIVVKHEAKNDEPLSDAEKVREFTYEAGQPCPEKPKLMNVEEVNFITKMILDEVWIRIP